MLKRREFLARLAALTATSLIPIPALARLAAGGSRKRVLVAGGGFAGLYAAELLRDRGFDVRLLEASGRLGGKAMGGELAGYTYDFGPQAFSKTMKRVQALGQRFGLTVVPRPKQKSFYRTADRTLKGKALDKLHKDFDTLTALAKDMYAQVDDPALRPALAAKSVMEWAAPHLQPEAVQYYRTSFASEWCAQAEEVSLLHFLEYERGYDGEDDEMDFRYREGLFRVAEGLARSVAPLATLNAPLESVDVEADGVRVRAGGQDLDADYLVIAVPLTKLARIPVRGATGLATLSSFQNAAVRKVLVHYDRQFWSAQSARVGAYATPCGLSIMDNSDEAARAYSIAVFVGGPSAYENPGREKILAKIAEVLGPEALSPSGYHEQPWLGDEFFCGGYATNRAPTRGDAAAIPLEVGGRVFLAGSEAAREFPSYVEGALFSAEEAVKGILGRATL